MKKLDAVIIGTGQAGPSLATRLTDAGMKVAIIERKLFGGTCVNVGCTPTKAMVASARAAHMARRSADFGVQLDGTVQVDLKKVVERKNDIIGRNNDQIPQWMKDTDNLTAYKGHARFKDAHTIEVNDDQLLADKIFINVGGRAFIPPLDGLDGVNYLTNSGILDMQNVPDHLIIIGGSYIGLEFAQMFRRFGSAVTVIERSPQLIGRDDPDIAAAIKDIMENEGIKVLLNNEVSAVKQNGNTIYVNVSDAKRTSELSGSHLLIAVGRQPNTDDLGLDRAGIATDKRGYITVNDQLQTNLNHVWALGDCNGRGAFTHTAYNDFEIVAANLLYNQNKKVSDRIITYALYIDPPLGRVGLTEKEVRASGKKALIAKYPMKQVARAREKSETDGFMKILVDADTSQILGAAILGTGGDEIVHLLTDIMYAGGPYSVIQNAVHIHPTVSELIPTMLSNLTYLE